MLLRRSALLAACSLVLTGAIFTSATAQTDTSEAEITAVEISPGVAVLFGMGGNIGVSYGDDGTILIDDQFAPLSDKIEGAVAELGADPTRFLINTHWHFDHAGGNENFGKAGATIFAHRNVRVRLAEGGNVMDTVVEPSPPEALPVVTYDESVTFHLNDDTIEVMFFGGGHTDGDSVILWREANVVHMGDLFMHQLGFPFVDISSGGNVSHLLDSLVRVIAMTDTETVIIPGHGNLATRADLIGFYAMVLDGVERVEALREQGMTLEQAIARKPVEGLRNADGFVSDDQFVTSVWGSHDAGGDAHAGSQGDVHSH